MIQNNIYQSLLGRCDIITDENKIVIKKKSVEMPSWLDFAGLGNAGLGVAGLGDAGVDVEGFGAAGLGDAGVDVQGLGVAGLGVAGLGVAGLAMQIFCFGLWKKLITSVDLNENYTVLSKIFRTTIYVYTVKQSK